MPIKKDKFKKGSVVNTMALEEIMQPDQAYTIKELVKITKRTSMRVGYKLRELETAGKAERRLIEGKIYWILTDKCYREGSIKSRVQLKIKPRGRPRPE
jgi:hypothetical protein